MNNIIVSEIYDSTVNLNFEPIELKINCFWVVMIVMV